MNLNKKQFLEKMYSDSSIFGIYYHSNTNTFTVSLSDKHGAYTLVTQNNESKYFTTYKSLFSFFDFKEDESVILRNIGYTDGF
jgi:hypothetical protein